MSNEAISVSVVGTKIRIKLPWSLMAHKDSIKAVPGSRWSKATKSWDFQATPSAALAIAEALAGVNRVATQEFRDLLAQARAQADAAIHKTANDLPEVPCTNPDTPTWNHQRQAFWFAECQAACLLYMDMGTGKSRVTVDLINHWQANLTLIIAPKKPAKIWPKQFRLYSCQEIDVEALVKTSMSGVQKAERARKLVAQAQQTGRPLVLVINYESVHVEAFAEFALSTAWDLIVLDEGHRVKAPGGVTSMFVTRLGKKAARRLELTGTPMPHSPLDIYAQYRFLDPGIFGTSFAAFKNRYAKMGGFDNRQVKAFINQDELSEKMFSIAYYAPASVLDLPPELDLPPSTCELSKSERELYNRIDKAFVALIGEKQITIDNALVELLRLQQITSGHVKTDDGEVIATGTAKAELLAELFEGLPRMIVSPTETTFEPVVVFVRFIHDLEVVKALAESTGRRYGEVSGRANDLTEDASYPEDVDVMAVQIQSGGLGVDLTRARYCFFYSVGFNLGDYLQARKRVHRPGQTRETFYYHLVAEDTVDEIVYEALEKRQSIVEYVVDLYRTKRDGKASS